MEDKSFANNALYKTKIQPLLHTTIKLGSTKALLEPNVHDKLYCHEIYLKSIKGFFKLEKTTFTHVWIVLMLKVDSGNTIRICSMTRLIYQKINDTLRYSLENVKIHMIKNLIIENCAIFNHYSFSFFLS